MYPAKSKPPALFSNKEEFPEALGGRCYYFRMMRGVAEFRPRKLDLADTPIQLEYRFPPIALDPSPSDVQPSRCRRHAIVPEPPRPDHWQASFASRPLTKMHGSRLGLVHHGFHYLPIGVVHRHNLTPKHHGFLGGEHIVRSYKSPLFPLPAMIFTVVNSSHCFYSFLISFDLLSQ